MSCSYYNKSKDDVWNGIYCNKIGGRPGNSYWDCYCNASCGDCPHLGGRDPYELHSDTKERNRVVSAISSLPRHIQVSDYSSIQAARRAYERLSYAQQRHVNNYSNLCAAESAYKQAVEDENNRQRRAYEAEQDQRRREEEARRQRDRNLENQRREQQRYEDEYQAERRTNTVPQTEKRYTDLPLWDRILFNLEHMTDPRMRSTHWAIRAYRVVLPLLLWGYALAFRPEWPPVEVNVFLVFATLQLVSFVVAFISPDAMKLRLILWFVELAILAIWGFMYSNAESLQYYHEVLILALIYPVLGIGYVVLRGILGMIL